MEIQTFEDYPGLIATMDTGKPGRTIMLRADIDALPVMENNDLPYKSKTPGIMHACGHDTHVACLLTLAEILSTHKELVKGTVKFVFQSAEEKLPGGAKQLCADGAMNDVDMIFGMHSSSGYPLGDIIVCQCFLLCEPYVFVVAVCVLSCSSLV